jgi:REP element-mobilizing transposase RayT
MLPKRVGVKVSSFLYDYSREKGIYMKSDYVNPDHAHAVIDLPTKYSIEKVLQLLKGASSHWINGNRLVAGKFARGRGYGAFSVSHSNLGAVVRSVENQEEHHRRKSFAEELRPLSRFMGWNGTMTRLMKLSRTPH